jgi:hypothetical protein
MVGIKVGGTRSGVAAGSRTAVAVWLGTGMAVVLAVVVGDGVADGETVIDCPHAVNNRLIRKTRTRNMFSILTHFPSIMKVMLFATSYSPTGFCARDARNQNAAVYP